MKPTSSSRPFFPQSSPTDRAESSARTASSEPGRTSSPDKSGTSKSRFGTSFNPSRLASGFTKLFGENTEAKEQLKQSARKILDHMEKNIDLDEKAKKKLNSFLRKSKTMTADEMERLAHTFDGLEKHRGRGLGSSRSALSEMTEAFASGAIHKDAFLLELKRTSQALDRFEIVEVVETQLNRLKQSDKSKNKYIFTKVKEADDECTVLRYKPRTSLINEDATITALKELSTRLEALNAMSPGTAAMKAIDAELKSLSNLDKSKDRKTFMRARSQYMLLEELVKELQSQGPHTKPQYRAKLEEFAALLEFVNAKLKKNPNANCYDDVNSFNTSSSRESQNQFPPRSRPSSSRESQNQFPPRSGPSRQQPESGLQPRRPQFAPRPKPQTTPEQASTVDAYAGPRLSIRRARLEDGVLRETTVSELKVEVGEYAETLKKHFSAGPLQELHGDLLALAGQAQENMRNAFNEKYKKVFETKYEDNPTGFSLLGAGGLKGCNGRAKDSKFFTVPSVHVQLPRR